MTHDLVVRGGSVLDGTGAPARTADVAVDGGRITEVGRVEGRSPTPAPTGATGAPPAVSPPRVM